MNSVLETDLICYVFCNLWVVVWSYSCLVLYPPPQYFLHFCRNQIIVFPLENDNNVVYLPSGYCILYFCSSAKIKWSSLTNYFNIAQLSWFSSAIGSIHWGSSAKSAFVVVLMILQWVTCYFLKNSYCNWNTKLVGLYGTQYYKWND